MLDKLNYENNDIKLNEIKSEDMKINNNDNINLGGLNKKELSKYNLYLEERDIIEVKITRKKKEICKGYFICVYGPTYYMDSLRINEPMEIGLDRGLSEKEFLEIFSKIYISQVSLIQLLIPNYSNDSILHDLLTKLIQKNLVGYLDFSDYELFIIPHGIHLIRYSLLFLDLEFLILLLIDIVKLIVDFRHG